MTNVTSIQRKDWIDALRAVAITLVVFGHQVPLKAFFVLTSPIKMPLFFAISGYLFTIKPIRLFLKKTFYGLVIPWLCLGLLPQLLLMPIKGFGSTCNYFVKMLLGEAIWFMPCFIIGSVIFFFTLKITENRLILGGGISIILFLVGIFLYNHSSQYSASLYRAMAVQPFFWFGYAFRQCEITKCKYISKGHDYKILLVMSILYLASVTSTFFLYPGKSIDVHLNKYFNIPLCALQITTGLFCMFEFFKRYNHFPRWVVEIGKCSLVIYIWHSYVIGIFKFVIEKLIGKVPLYPMAIMSTIVAVIVCYLLNKIIKRYVPFMIGDR